MDTKSDPDFARWGSGYGYGYGRRLEREFGRIEREIVTAADRGEISSKEECRLLHQLADIDGRYDAFRSKALGYRERRTIVQRLGLIRSEICRDRNVKAAETPTPPTDRTTV